MPNRQSHPLGFGANGDARGGSTHITHVKLASQRITHVKLARWLLILPNRNRSDYRVALPTQPQPPNQPDQIHPHEGQPTKKRLFRFWLHLRCAAGAAADLHGWKKATVRTCVEQRAPGPQPTPSSTIGRIGEVSFPTIREVSPVTKAGHNTQTSKMTRRHLLGGAASAAALAAGIPYALADDAKQGVKNGRIKLSLVQWCLAPYWDTAEM